MTAKPSPTPSRVRSVRGRTKARMVPAADAPDERATWTPAAARWGTVPKAQGSAVGRQYGLLLDARAPSYTGRRISANSVHHAFQVAASIFGVDECVKQADCISSSS